MSRKITGTIRRPHGPGIIIISLLIVLLAWSVTFPVSAANTTTTATTAQVTATSTTAPVSTTIVVRTTTATITATTTATTIQHTTTATTATTVPATTVVSQPVIGFSGSPIVGEAPLEVQFTDLSTGSPTGWEWDFGDGTSDTVQNPSHTYTSSGTYTVKLTATVKGAGYTKTQSGYVSIDEPVTTVTTTTTTTTGTTSSSSIIAGIAGSPTTGTAPLTVRFNDTSIGSPTSWKWDFGDGATSTLKNPAHTYDEAGNYSVSLVASNGDTSNTARKINYISVNVPFALQQKNETTLSSTVSSTPYPTWTKTTPAITGTSRQTGTSSSTTPVLTGQAWLDRENRKLAEADALAAQQEKNNNILAQVVNFVKSLFSWIK